MVDIPLPLFSMDHYTLIAGSRQASLSIFNPVQDDHFQILFFGLFTDVREHSVVGHQIRTHIMAVLLEKLAINRKVVFVGELTTEVDERARVALAEGMDLPERGEVMGEVFDQLIKIIVPPLTTAHRVKHLGQTLPDVGIIRVFHREPAQCRLFLDDVHLPMFASQIVEILKDIPVKHQI